MPGRRRLRAMGIVRLLLKMRTRQVGFPGSQWAAPHAAAPGNALDLRGAGWAASQIQAPCASLKPSPRDVFIVAALRICFVS